MDQRLKCKSWNYKPIEENTGGNLGFSNAFLDMTPKAQATKGKTDKVDFIKIVKFPASKNTTKKEKRQPSEWEKKKICKACI